MKPKQASVRSVRRPSYNKGVEKAPDPTRELAERNYEKFFCEDPTHRALQGEWVPCHSKKIDVWRVWVGPEYRAVAIVEKEGEVTTYVWFWFGHHKEYDRLFGGAPYGKRS